MHVWYYHQSSWLVPGVPRLMVIAEQFKFNSRYQKEEEMVATFSVELKKLASTWEFSGFLDDALRYRFVAGLKDR